MSGHLYIIGTPIGNLKDITLRALETLKTVDLIACEDTRHSRILLENYSIRTTTTSFHKYNIKTKTKYLIGRMKSGKNIALISDAGMPAISDPGSELVAAAAAENIRVIVIPGACAAISALSVSGFMNERFIFEGFLPAKQSARRERLVTIANENGTIILYEAPHRLLSTLEELKKYVGDREIIVARELTKKFEELSRGAISQVIEKFSKRKPRGEFVLVIGGKPDKKPKLDVPQLLIADMVAAGVKRSDAVKMLSKRFDMNKNELYRASLEV